MIIASLNKNGEHYEIEVDKNLIHTCMSHITYLDKVKFSFDEKGNLLEATADLTNKDCR